MQANAAIRFEGSANHYHSDDAVNRSQQVKKMGGLNHSAVLGRPIILQFRNPDHRIVVTAFLVQMP